ncbi:MULTISPECIES: hypothetical protein [unclassified Amycolatopsis]|uniref:hypothetical protein n=1 Tax=unclassified Amycolatopsis TaxID=2618356 RepID=UPI001FF62D1B|nr:MULTISPECIES: hypothetical protein [unclassified Amycolatopsis]UOZ05024.1 hypothetical protein MUY22_40350 [Amycolatopsis sp. WQ 127309]WSJ80593.1 hypothetical protein OG439_16835 [Amycolatopsis sp. NBC_01307]WSK75969.1 hypothetical protein OG570_31960 [Amycolatopsis sp. NBC_01286]
MGEELRTSREQRSKRDEGEPTPIFDAVASAARAGSADKANTGNPAGEGKAGR